MKKLSAATVVSWAVVGGFLLISIFPFFWILITSFKPGSEIFGDTAFRIIPQNPTLHNYITVIVEKGILNAVKNSFIVSILTTVYVVIVASMSAYIIARFRFRGKTLLMGLILSVSMFPQMIIVGPVFNMFYSINLLNSYWVTLAYSTITLPSAVWIMVTHFKKIPLAIEEAAQIDGCSPWRILWKVVFPVAAPGVFTTAIMTFIAAWNEYLLTYTLNSDKMYQTVPVAINALRTQFSILWGEITAATITVVIPTLIIVLIFQKQIVSGIVNGAVKE
ncbi:carbohydrate ABC transporter permease [Hydrogenoanaerobacterium sp.]|uniref:carbohydrate ABC transporter permease n=1 Tax=Hydrogenoanaerobacterium sp. TaxID=2953763 RepID=UPI002899B241|nr:carbohydrate ABC transporter permease [Hydrogenoanaerobacterium sp.]